MERIEFQLFGGFGCLAGGKPVEVTGTRKMRALLAYLALGIGQRHAREKLATLLWGNSADRQAANSLNQAVYSIRKQFPLCDSALLSDHEFVWLDPDLIETDVRRFEEEAQSRDAPLLGSALMRYRGALLDGLDLNEETFADWLRLERSRLETLAIATGEQLVGLHENQPDETSVQQAQHLLAIDPSNETAHRHLMRHHGLHGRTQAALRQFEECRRALDQAFEALPSKDTTQLADAIAAGKLQSTSVPGDTAGSARNRTRWPIVAAICLLLAAAAALIAIREMRQHDAAPESMRLAVIPFEVAGQAVDPAFAHGLADDVTTELASTTDLAVISRESATRLAQEETGQFAQHGVTHLLRGRLRQRGSRQELVLHLWLVETASDTQVWAESFSGPLDDLVSLQERALVGIDAALARLLGRESPEVMSVASQNPIAYDHYLRGLTFQFEGTPEGHAEAARAYKQALDLDPGFDKARAAFAAINFDLAFGPQAFAEAQDTSWIEAYLHLKHLLGAIRDDSVAQAQILASRLALRRRDYRAAIDLGKSAMAAAPGSAQAVEAYAEALIYNGDFAAGEAQARQALALNPATPSRPIYLLALAAFGRGDNENAIAHGENAVDLAHYPQAEILGLLSAAFGVDGKLEPARRYLDEYVEAVSDRPRHVWKTVSTAYSNPRETTWQRPNLASMVYSYPFDDEVILKRLAHGLTEAGIAGRTLGYLPTARADRLEDQQITELLFGATIRGRSIRRGSSAEWMQFRSADGELEQIGDFGPLLLAHRGTSITRGDQLCDRWEHEGQAIESCASVFRIFDGVEKSIAGTHLMTSEFGLFVFTPITE